MKVSDLKQLLDGADDDAFIVIAVDEKAPDDEVKHHLAEPRYFSPNKIIRNEPKGWVISGQGKRRAGGTVRIAIAVATLVLVGWSCQGTDKTAPVPDYEVAPGLIGLPPPQPGAEPREAPSTPGRPMPR